MKHTALIATLLLAFASTSVTWAQTVRPTVPAKATAAPAKPAATPSREATTSARERLDAAAAAQKTDGKQLSVRAQSKFGTGPVSPIRRYGRARSTVN